jgi:TolB-like protein
LEFQDLGRRALKNIEQPVRTYRIASAGIGVGVTGSGSVPVDIVPRLPERPSLAILPFRNVNGTEDTEFIADGIGLSIQTLLVQLSGLFFINACSNQAYKEGRTSAAEAMRDFPVRYALEGSVQRAGKRVRVTAQVTDLSNGEAVWAERYDRNLEDVFVLQDDITREVIISLSSEIQGAIPERISIRSLAGPDAWEPYLRGVSHFYKFTSEDNAFARRKFERVYELHPDKMIGPGYVALTHWLDATRGWSASRGASLSQAAEWAEKSTVSEEENNGLGHAVLGSVRLLEGEFDEALTLCRKSVAFRASCPFALGQLAAVQNYCGDATGAVKSAREALSVRTMYPPPLLNILAIAYRDSGKVGLSIPTALEASRLDPKFADAYATVCSGYALSGDDDEARRAADEIMEMDPEFRLSTYAKKHVYKDADTISGIVEALRSAGLPD